MAFDSTAMVLMAHPAEWIGPNFYAYSTADTFATVLGADYFDAYYSFLSANDTVTIYCSDGWGQVQIKSVSGTVVVTSSLALRAT